MQRIRRGLFAIWKPPDVLSTSAVSTIKNILQGEKRGRGGLKVGHGGTLDKFAEGILVIGVGTDCKQLGLYTNSTIKSYVVTCELGKVTDTLDVNGIVVQEAPWEHVGRADVEHALETFRGTTSQTPPLFSALKVRGKRLSDFALEARETNTAMPVAPKPRTVTIHSIELLRFEPPHFTIAATCSSGTYMRSLMRDISLKVGSVGHSVSLIRNRQGKFSESMALRVDDWTEEKIAQAVESEDRIPH